MASPVKRPATYDDLLQVALGIMNPLTRTLEVHRLADGRWLLLSTHEGEVSVRAEPFDAVELELGPLWGEADPAEDSTAVSD